ncbi:MAG: PBP1A family penicillin-binding protein [Desulfobacteraceae bacterium]|nr:PBP1A family penicillin-binding protein [Desulfobacteraceae bacterium]
MDSPIKRIIVFIVFLGILAGLLMGTFLGLLYDLPEINHLKQFKPSSVTTVFSSDNQIITRFYLEKRFPVPIKKIPKSLIDALIATEDRNFFRHSGINLKAILRALVHDIKAGGFKQGASTLTQQLAKTLFLSPEKSIIRKIREAILAVQIERRYTKNEILELYLNLIYLGSGAYGVEAAARTYFDTSVADLTLGQAALIAGLPKAPSTYSPLNNPRLAEKRRSIVLGQMRRASIISRKAQTLANNEPVSIDTKLPPPSHAPFFVAYLKNILKLHPGLRSGFSNGLNIYTSLDLRLQNIAETSAQNQIQRLKKRMEKNGLDNPMPEVALIAIDIKTGGILSMVGGIDFGKNEFNRAVQAKRQPGSAFKPFVYATALGLGYSQAHTLLDAPLSYSSGKNKRWEVKNFSRNHKGEMTLRAALALSKNTPVVRLLEEISPEAVIKFAQKAGINSLLHPYLSLALGTSEVSLLELTSAYVPFANKGIQVTPSSIVSIKDADKGIIFQNSITRQSIMSRENAAIMADMLKAVIFEGTGKKANHIKKDIAGKTGTTDQYKDAYFIGISPGIALGVWVGNDDSTTLGPYETGAKTALPIWIDYMEAFLEDKPFQYFDIPDGTKMIYIHPDTGKILSQTNSKAVRALIKTKDKT